jgi:hypothetical protein
MNHTVELPHPPLPLLTRNGFSGPVLCTPSMTRQAAVPRNQERVRLG